MKNILGKIESAHYERYNENKLTYVDNALALVRYHIANRKNDADDAQIIDMFKVLMICCFQNKNENGFFEFFTNRYTKTGLHIEEELKKDNSSTADLRAKLFGSEHEGVLPSYKNMVNLIYQQEIKKYDKSANEDNSPKQVTETKISFNEKNFTDQDPTLEVTCVKAPNGAVDVLRTASLLIKDVHSANVLLTVRRLCKDEYIQQYYDILINHQRPQNPV